MISPVQDKSPLWEGRAFGQKKIVAGWFRDKEKAAALVRQVKAEGVYVTLNPCQEALLARAHERLKANADRTTDPDIAAIWNLLIDLDPRRPAGVSSADPEHEAALNMAQVIKADLAGEGWPEPPSRGFRQRRRSDLSPGSGQQPGKCGIAPEGLKRTGRPVSGAA